MAISLSQHAEASDASLATSRNITLVSVTSAGDHVIVFASGGNGSATFTVSGLGATWTQLGTDSSSAYFLFSGTGCTSGNTVVTVATSSSLQLDMLVTVWAGAGSVASSALTSGSSAAVNTPTVTPTATAQVVVGGWAQSGLADTWSSFVDNPSAWTTIVSNFVGNRRFHEGSVTGTTSAASESATNSTVRGWGSFAAVLSTPVAPAYHRANIHAQSRAVARASVI